MMARRSSGNSCFVCRSWWVAMPYSKQLIAASSLSGQASSSFQFDCFELFAQGKNAFFEKSFRLMVVCQPGSWRHLFSGAGLYVVVLNTALIWQPGLSGRLIGSLHLRNRRSCLGVSDDLLLPGSSVFQRRYQLHEFLVSEARVYLSVARNSSEMPTYYWFEQSCSQTFSFLTLESSQSASLLIHYRILPFKPETQVAKFLLLSRLLDIESSSDFWLPFAKWSASLNSSNPYLDFGLSPYIMIGSSHRYLRQSYRVLLDSGVALRSIFCGIVRSSSFGHQLVLVKGLLHRVSLCLSLMLMLLFVCALLWRRQLLSVSWRSFSAAIFWALKDPGSCGFCYDPFVLMA